MRYRNIITASALCAALILSGCDSAPAESTTAISTTTAETKRTYATRDTSDITTAVSAVMTTADETTAEPEPDPADMPVLFIDLNDDGVDEEFYIEDGHYRVVSKAEISGDSSEQRSTVGRPDKLHIFRSNDEYCYLFDTSGVYGNYIGQHNFTVTDQGINIWWGFGKGIETGKQLRYYIRDNVGNTDRAGFNSTFLDPRSYADEYQSYSDNYGFGKQIEYLGTLDIDSLVNTDRIEHHLKTLDLATGAPPIEVYSLENDAFGARKMLKCGDRTIFSDDHNYLTVYSRFPEMAQADDTIRSDRREYLLCLSSRDMETADLIYMGFPDENYLAHYDDPVPANELDSYLSEQGWKLRSEKISIYDTYWYHDENAVEFDFEKTATAYADYGTSLDVLMGSETKLVFCTDEEEFGEPELLQKVRKAYYGKFTEKIKRHNDSNPEENAWDNVFYDELVPARTINEPADIPFIKGIHYDFDNDGEDEVIAMIGIEVWECVFYYADGDKLVNPSNIEFGATNGREADDDEICTEVYGNEISVWDFGDYRFFTHQLGSPSVSFTTIYRCKDGGIFEPVNHIASDYNSFNEAGFVWIKHHPNIFTHCDYLVCTPDGELKEIGNESITPEKFREIYEKDEQMQAAFRNAELDRNTFGELDVNSITEVYMKGYYDFILIADGQNELNWYYYSEGRVSTAYDYEKYYYEDMLYDVNLYRLNVAG